MRHAVLMLAAITMLMAGGTDAEPVKPFPADVGSGRIAWFDLTTTDLQKPQAFYGKLLG
jgi:hypothetical protein